MNQPIELKSNLINALLPKFLKHLFYNLLFLIPVYLFYLLINRVEKFNVDAELIFILTGLAILFSIFKISRDLIKILNTTFKFYPHYVEVHFKFIHEKSHSINYSQITDIRVNKTIWDRIFNVGDIVIHTATDEYRDKSKELILKDLKNPDHIKNEITKRIHLSK